MGGLPAGILAGLGLFLGGMWFLCRGLAGLAGTRLRRVLAIGTGKVGRAFGLGLVVTAFVQSSSAVIALTLGLVDVGLMAPTAALAVVLGANVGTTLTAHLLSLPLLDCWWLFLGVGGLLVGRGLKPGSGGPEGPVSLFFAAGLALLGFGFLLAGLGLLEKVLAPLAELPVFMKWLQTLDASPWQGIVAGALLTGVIQSSSLVVALLLTVARLGWLDLAGAVAFVMGSNIGTCGDTLLAAVGRGVAARRVAWAHLGFNLAGTALWGFCPAFVSLVRASAVTLPQQVANAHTLFNLLTAAFFFPWVWWLGRRRGEW